MAILIQVKLPLQTLLFRNKTSDFFKSEPNLFPKQHKLNQEKPPLYQNKSGHMGGYTSITTLV